MTVNAVSVGAVSASPLPRPPSAAAEGSALLPDPGASTPAACGDAMTMLYVTMSQQNSLALQSGEMGVSVQSNQRAEQNKLETDALAKEKKADGDGSKGFFASVGGLIKDVTRDVAKGHIADAVHDAGSDVVAAWNSPKFWQDVEFGATKIAQAAAIVGSVAASVATFGGASVGAVAVTALVLSTASTAESDFHVLEACGVKGSLAADIGLGCAGAGLLVGGVGALTSSAEELAQLSEVAKNVSSAMEAADGTAQIVSSGAHVKNGYFAAAAEDDKADATQADVRMQSVTKTINMIIDGLQDTSQSQRRALASLQSAIQTDGQTLVISAGRMA